MARRRRVKGGDRIKRILRNLPVAFRTEIVDVLEESGTEMVPAMQAKTPRQSGALRAGMSHQVQRQPLKLRVGLLGTKAGRSDLFYGKIQDLGRRAQAVNVTRRKNTKPYVMRVAAMAGKHFVTGQYAELRTSLREKLVGIFGRALRRLGGNGG